MKSFWHVLWFVVTAIIIIVPFKFETYPLTWVVGTITALSAFCIGAIVNERIEKFIAYTTKLECTLENNNIPYAKEKI